MFIISQFNVIIVRHRSRTDILAQILEAVADGGAAKTKIMYKAFMSYAQLKEYLIVMLSNDLLNYVEGEKLFRITEKGKRFLDIYNNAGEIILPQ